MQLEIEYEPGERDGCGLCLQVRTRWTDGGYEVRNCFWVTAYQLAYAQAQGRPWSIFDLINGVVDEDAPAARALLAAKPYGLSFPPAPGLH